jgi:hypothetical protein
MPPCLIALTGAVAIFAGSIAAQTITVVGTGDPNVDIPAVQAAVDQGGRVTLTGHFSFDAPPTVVEAPSILYSGTALGTIRVSRTTEISGAKDDKGAMPDINGGTNPFYVEAPGSHVTIQGLHFIHTNVVVIRVVAVRGLVITANRIDGVARGVANAVGILVGTTPSPPTAAALTQTENVSGTLSIGNNEIDMLGGADGIYLCILVYAAGKSPDHEADLHISGNDIRNSTERPINVQAIGGRVHIERNRVTTGNIGFDVTPSGDVIHIVGPGLFLIAHNTIDCAWTSGAHAGIRLQSNPGELVSYAIVEDNDINMATPYGTMFTATSSAIEVRGAGEGNMVLNNRIRGRANFALSVVAQNGSPQSTTFLMNDIQDFSASEAGLFVDAGASNTVSVGQPATVEDHGTGTVIVTWTGNKGKR